MWISVVIILEFVYIPTIIRVKLFNKKYSLHPIILVLILFVAKFKKLGGDVYNGWKFVKVVESNV